MCDCDGCERMLQPYLDRVLTEAELAEAEEHLEDCEDCRKRYRFEESLHMYVRQAVVAEQMPVELKRRLAALRTPL